MRPNPAEEWQRLTKLYGEMSDGQLLELAESYGDLTETAQPILRDEMKKRRLEGPELQGVPGRSSSSSTFAAAAARFDDPKSSADGADEGDEKSGSVEYTWKTQLCDCETSEEAWQISEVLRIARIESWTVSPPAEQALDMRNIRILVAADQIDEARAIIARPIPQDIIDQSKVKVEDFAPPTCPKCGAADPLLESVDPVNTWSCEVCGATWSDSTAFHEASSEPVS